MLKNIDKRFKEIGFIKVKENEHGVSYERKDKQFDFIQVLDILHRTNGNHLMQSYDKNLMDIKNIGNICIGLTYQEIMLVLEKMKNM